MTRERITLFPQRFPRTTVEGLGIQLHPASPATADPDPQVLLGLALRDNPRRAQLLVSRVLGKHIPTDPRLVHAAGLLLGARVADVLAGRPPRRMPVDLLHAAVREEVGAAAELHATACVACFGACVCPAAVAPAAIALDVPASDLPASDLAASDLAAGPVDALVLGFAETATALGHSVAEALGGAHYLHSTRRPSAHLTTTGTFTEEHSHHTDHLLLPSDPALLADPRPLVLVDDELSTGRTVVNTIVALHRLAPRERYVVAALVDLRAEALTGLPDGVRVDVVALTRAGVTLPADITERAAALRAERAHRVVRGNRGGNSVIHARGVGLAELGWPPGLPTGGRHGFTPAHHRALADALPGLAARLAAAADVRPDERTLVLGTEELMAIPLRLAVELAAGSESGVWFSATTRSPAVVVDEPDYALTSSITFPAHDDPADGPGPRYAYNVAGTVWDHALVVVDPEADTPELKTGLLAALAPHTRRTTVVAMP